MVDDDRRVTIDLPFETAVGAAAGAIQREGLTILARIDVRDHFKTELHHEFRQYMMLEAWVPALAFEEIRADLDEGAATPIRFAVYELADGETAESPSISAAHRRARDEPSSPACPAQRR